MPRSPKSHSHRGRQSPNLTSSHPKHLTYINQINNQAKSMRLNYTWHSRSHYCLGGSLISVLVLLIWSSTIYKKVWKNMKLTLNLHKGTLLQLQLGRRVVRRQLIRSNRKECTLETQQGKWHSGELKISLRQVCKRLLSWNDMSPIFN